MYLPAIVTMTTHPVWSSLGFACRCVASFPPSPFSPQTLPVTPRRCFARLVAALEKQVSSSFASFSPLALFVSSHSPGSLSPSHQPPPMMLLKFILLAGSISMETSRNHGNYLNEAKRFQNSPHSTFFLPLPPAIFPLSIDNGAVSVCAAVNFLHTPA